MMPRMQFHQQPGPIPVEVAQKPMMKELLRPGLLKIRNGQHRLVEALMECLLRDAGTRYHRRRRLGPSPRDLFDDIKKRSLT